MTQDCTRWCHTLFTFCIIFAQVRLELEMLIVQVCALWHWPLREEFTFHRFSNYDYSSSLLTIVFDNDSSHHVCCFLFAVVPFVASAKA
jgi:hypothetical protein